MSLFPGIPVQPKPLTAPTCVADGLDYLDTLATLGRSLIFNDGHKMQEL